MNKSPFFFVLKIYYLYRTHFCQTSKLFNSGFASFFFFSFVCSFFIIYQVLPGKMIIHRMLLVRNSQPFTKSTTDTPIYLHLKNLTQEGKSTVVVLPVRFMGGFVYDEKKIGPAAVLNT